MKPITTYAVGFFLFLALFFTVSSGVTKADQGAAPVSGTAFSTVTGPDSASGTAEFTIGDKAYTATFSLTFSIGAPDENGVSQTVSAHIFTVSRGGEVVGTFTTSDNGVLSFNNNGTATLNNTLNIVSGTGKFNHTTGTLYTVNNLDFTQNPPTATTTISGSVSKK